MGHRDQLRTLTHLGEIEYTDTGTGPTLVFLHLVLAAGDHWDELSTALSDRYRCIAPTLPMGAHRLPAHADADLTPTGLAAAVAELLENLDVNDATLIGNDTGGAIAQIVAADHGERVARLVLNNCDMYDEFPPKLFATLRPIARTPAGLYLLSQIMRIKATWYLPIAFGRLTHTRHDHDDKIRRWGAALRNSRHVRRDASKAILGMNPSHTNNAARTLATNQRPTLIAWGNDDRVFTYANAERFAIEIPNTYLELIADACAFVCWDQPERLAHLIDHHIQTHLQQ